MSSHYSKINTLNLEVYFPSMYVHMYICISNESNILYINKATLENFA